MMAVLTAPMVGGPCTGPCGSLGWDALGVPVIVWYTTTAVRTTSTGSA